MALSCGLPLPIGAPDCLDEQEFQKVQSGEQCGGLNEGRSLPLFLLVSYMPSRLLNIQKFDWIGERLRISLLA